MHGPINIGFFPPILEYMNPIEFGGGSDVAVGDTFFNIFMLKLRLVVWNTHRNYGKMVQA